MNPGPYNPFSLDGKRILVTGASSGIGRSTAIECSRLGAKVVLVACRGGELRQTLSMLDGDGHAIEPFDLSGSEDIVDWLTHLAARTGLLDGLFHSAGISSCMPVRFTTPDLYRKIMVVNLDAAYWLAKGFRQKAVRTPKASLVFVSSVSGVVGNAGLTAYAASKGGLLALTKSLALEFVKEHIRVNVVAPALVTTNMAEEISAGISEEQFAANAVKQPLGIGQPEDVAWAVIYLLSDAFRWITGSTLAVDGGYTAA